MPVLEFKIKLVTPAFIAGAMNKKVPGVFDNQGKPTQHRIIGPDGDGLRIPSLKGVLRFWYRSIHGGLSLERLKEEESKVFGDAKRYQGVRIIPTEIPDFKAEPLVAGAGSAAAYLGYGPMGYSNRTATSHNRNMYRDVIPAGTTFGFKAIGTPEQIEGLKLALTLLHFFGGVGARSRRGFGSVKVIGDFIPQYQGNYNDWFEKNGWTPFIERKSVAKAKPSFSAFWNPDTACKLFPVATSYDTIWKDFYQRFKDVRLYDRFNPPASSPIGFQDHGWEAADAANPSGPITHIPERIAYGMPYHPKSQNNGWDIKYTAAVTRRASPLFLKVMELAPNQYIGVALFLRARFFGSVPLDIGAEGHTGTLLFPGCHAVDEFMK